MEDQINELENTVSRLTSDVEEITGENETLKREIEGLRSDIDTDLVECLHWMQGRLETLEKRLAIIPLARPGMQKTD